MIRYFILATSLLLAPTAFAQTPFEYAQTQHCDGKYTDAADTIDAAHDLYGTLYAGGNHFTYFHDNLRETINLYRAMQGFAPLAPTQRHIRGNIEPTAPALTRALRLLTWPDPGMSPDQIEQHIVVIDRLTSSGPADDWWLRIDDFKSAPQNPPRYNYYASSEDYIEYATTHVTGAQRMVAGFVKRHDELDWLQSALILSNYDHPWIAADGRSPTPDLSNLFDHIEKKAMGGDYNRAWLALLSHHQFYGRDVPESLKRIQHKIATDIETCSASPEHYAALISGNYLVSDAAMPPKHLDLNLQIEARKVTIKNTRSPLLDSAYYFDISTLKDRAQNKAKFALPLMLSAPNMTEFENAAALGPNITRPPLVLSGQNLENISPYTAITRHISMNRPADAKRVLDSLISKQPSLQQSVDDLINSDLPENIQTAMIALRQPCFSHFISGFCTVGITPPGVHLHRDLESHYKSGEFLQEEFDSWLYPNHARYYYRHSIGAYYLQHNLGSERYYPMKNRRRSQVRQRTRPLINGQNRYRSEAPLITAALNDPALPKTGLLALADWDEFNAITGERRLTRALSVDIIEWVRSAPTDPVMAEALHRVVYLNKHQSGGKLDEKPVGKIAFELLHQKFPNSTWSKKTPYWW